MVSKQLPVGVGERDAAEREELPLRELARLVQEEEVHLRIGMRRCAGRQRKPVDLADVLYATMDTQSDDEEEADERLWPPGQGETGSQPPASLTR